jgi:hypothetical protein
MAAPIMTFRPPRHAAFARLTQAPTNALDYEIAQEMASALGRLGRALERALAALTEFDARFARQDSDIDAWQSARSTLVAEAGHALWWFIVQREAGGLRDSRSILRDYGVPPEVRARMGALPVQTSRRDQVEAPQASPRRSQK